MSRNKLYRNRVEVCLNDDQWDIVKELQKDKKGKISKTANEVIRMCITEYWENI